MSAERTPGGGGPWPPDRGPDPLFEESLHLAEEGRWEEVAERLRDALPDRPDDPYLLCWLGIAEEELGMEGVAYERFRRALLDVPEDPTLLATVGNALARFDDPEAESVLRAATTFGPENAFARRSYGTFLAHEGLHGEAMRELGIALELAPEDPAVLYAVGRGRAIFGDLAGATDALAAAIRFGPDDGWTQTLLGLVLFEEGRAEEAIEPLLSGARLRPADIEAQLLAALAAAAGGYEAEALEMLERARLVGSEGDQAAVAVVEERIDTGPEAAVELLTDELVPSTLRTRLALRE